MTFCCLVDFCVHFLYLVFHFVQDGFAEVSTTDGKFFEAVWSAVIHTGLGPLSPNTILLSFPSFETTASEQAQREMGSYIRTLNGVLNLGKAIILFKGSPNYPSTNCVVSGKKSIDIWWIVYDGGLLLLLPFLLSKHSAWCYEEEPPKKQGRTRLRRRKKAEAKLRLFVIKTLPQEDTDVLRASVIQHLEMMRIHAEVVVIDALASTNISKYMRDINSVGSGRANKMSSREQNNKGKQKALNRVASLIEDGISTHHMTMGEVFLEGSLPEDASAAEYYGSDIESGKQENVDSNDRPETSALLNRMIKKNSADANLVVTNLPFIPDEADPKEYFEFINGIVDGIDNVMLVRGSGAEVITAIA